MPYIPKERREELRRQPWGPQTPGELAFWITNALLEYVALQNGGDYAVYSQVVGVLETVKMEIYRRVVGPYEDRKRDVNGEVF